MAAKRKKTDPKLAKLYEQRRREFTAADLVKYTEITPTVPARQVIAELEAMHRKHGKKNGRKKSA
jgi:hypothetical protein